MDPMLCVGKAGDHQLLTSKGVNGDTYFDIASCGKVLHTSTLILKAIGEKKLSLQDTLGKFFEVKEEVKRNITMEQLLTHTSGIIRTNIPIEVCQGARNVVADFILSQPLLFAP